MRKMKLTMNQPNYINIHPIHIFFNFNKSNLDYLQKLHKDGIQKIHVFITTHESVNDNLRLLIDYFHQKKIIIHVPRSLKDLHTLVTEYLSHLSGKYRCIRDRKTVTFQASYRYKCDRSRIRSSSGYVHIIQKNDVYGYRSEIKTNSYGVAIQFPDYPYDGTDDNSGVFSSAEERLNPLQFREKLIAEFKKRCPSDILKGFKGDDDIFDYIMQEGEWKIKGEA